MYTAEQVKAAAPIRPVLPNANKPPFIGPAGIPGYRDINGFNDTFFYELAAVYLGRVSYTDYVLGALLDGIAASPLAGNTALLFSSDHGDFSGDYHNVEKYPCSLDDMLTRVPLIGRVPGGAKGARVAAPVEALDLFATLLDLAGLLPNASSALTSRTIERHFSQSLLPALLGSPSAPPPKKYVYSEGGYTPGSLEVEPLDPEQADEYSKQANMYYPRGREELNASHCTRAVMQRNLTAKLVYRPAPGQSELYDLASDPAESVNVWGQPQYALLQATMVLDMLDWFAQTSDITPLAEDPRGLPGWTPTPPFPWPPGAKPQRRHSLRG
jgi:choline-sulfatase